MAALVGYASSSSDSEAEEAPPAAATPAAAAAVVAAESAASPPKKAKKDKKDKKDKKHKKDKRSKHAQPALPSLDALLAAPRQPDFLQVATSGPEDAVREIDDAPPAERREAQKAPSGLSAIEEAARLAAEMERQQRLAKQQKPPKTFKEKEGRKRRLGQVSRGDAGGNYVENEKRVLREVSGQ